MTTQHPEHHEPHPDPAQVASPTKNVSDIDYAPDPSKSIPLTPARQDIVDRITSLYSGSASEQDMRVYAEKAIYDDPWSYCDTRYKIAGQWYGIPKIMTRSRTLATQIVASTNDPPEIIFKLRQEYTPVLSPVGKAVNSLVTLRLQRGDGGAGAEGQGDDGSGAPSAQKEVVGDRELVIYHKDMWNEKDYSHQGLGAVFKRLNGDYLTHVTKPPTTL